MEDSKKLLAALGLCVRAGNPSWNLLFQLCSILPPSLPSLALRMLSGLHGWVPRPVGNPGGRSEERGARGQGISSLAPAGRSLLAGHGL